MNPIDIQNPTASIPGNNPNDINGVRMSRIYGDFAEMLRLHNAYRPSMGDKYNLSRIRRKRGEYELRQLQTAIQNERFIYSKELGISILDLENRISESPEIMELIFHRAIDRMPKQCKTIIGNIQSIKPNREVPNE
jgi:hypothetical protein